MEPKIPQPPTSSNQLPPQSPPEQNQVPPSPTPPPTTPSPQPTISIRIPLPLQALNPKLIGIIGGLIIILGLGTFLALRGKPQSTPTPANQNNNFLAGPTKKYEKDTDQDGYPDIIEQAVGLDPNVSELTRCTNSGCAQVNRQTTQRNHNVLIILDGSGSMAAKVGSLTKMEAAKAAIKNYVNQSAATTKIGLMVYGQAGSNSEKDKAISCSSAVVVAPLGEINPVNLEAKLSGIKPMGWTPIGYSLRQARSQFSDKLGDNNEIILVSDGAESCNSDPVGAARELKTMGVKVNIIAFGASFSELASLQEIASAGGGTYASANSYEELDQRFADQYRNSLKLFEQSKCEGAALESFTKCWSEAYNKVYQWIINTKMSFYNKKISREEYDYLDNLSSELFKRYQEESNRQLELFNQKAREINRQIRGE